MTEPRDLIIDKTVELDQPNSEQSLWCSSVPSVRGSGFVPVQEVRLVTKCVDGAGRAWSSMNNYLISAEQRFDTRQTAAMGDAYYGINAEGPYISMVCEQGKGHDFTLPSDGTLRYQLSLFDGSEEVWSQELERVSQAEPSATTDIRIFFLQQGAAAGIHGANQLSSLGFRVENHTVNPENPDLDHLLEALRKTLADGQPTYLISSGRASEAALELAQRCQGLSAVLLFSGSGLRFSSWKLDGRELPFVACEHSSLRPRSGTVCTRTVYAEAVASKSNREQGRISVEKIECPLYMFSGLDDQVWPSSAFSELAAQRRKQKDCQHPTVHKTFEGVGHDIGPELGLPTLPTTERTLSHPPTGFRLLLGGKMGRQSRARRECWDMMLQVLSGRTLSL